MNPFRVGDRALLKYSLAAPRGMTVVEREWTPQIRIVKCRDDSCYYYWSDYGVVRMTWAFVEELELVSRKQKRVSCE